jgi:hypothetical protein
MMRRFAPAAVCACALAAGGSAVGQATTFTVSEEPRAQASAQGAPRDKLTDRTGSGAIRGRILVAETGVPLRRARVSLQGDNPLDARGTTTDLDGFYEFTDLAAGEYRVTASKGLFVPLAYGQRRWNERGTAVTVADGKITPGIDIALPRGGIIAGVLLDDVGEPAAGIRVTAMRQQFRDGRRGLVAVGRAVETNDLGQDRIYGLAPGSYFVGALPSTANPLLPMMNAPTGAPTYYPGALSEAEAQRVLVRGGEERFIADFTLVPSRLVKVAGTVNSATGAPAQMVIITSTSQVAANTAPSITTGVVKPDGSFQLSNVAPGEYIIMASVMHLPTGEQQMAAMPITVAGEDVHDVILHVAAGFRVTGQIAFDQPSSPTAISPSSLALVATPSSQHRMSGGLGRVAVRDDWTFEAKGLAGPRLFRFIQGLPSGWMIQSVTHGHTDITDTPIDVSEDVDGILITLTNRPGHLSGSVVDGRGNSVPEYTVVIFPEDAALAPPATSRHTRALRAGADHRFKADMLPAATYLVAAVDWLEPGDENDPEVIELLRPQAVRVPLGWGEARELTLRLARINQ